MISAQDVPACPACGSREVHPVQKAVGEKTFFACRGCGRDQTDAWAPLQNKPKPAPVIGAPPLLPDPPDPLALGVGATIKAAT